MSQHDRPGLPRFGFEPIDNIFDAVERFGNWLEKILDTLDPPPRKRESTTTQSRVTPPPQPFPTPKPWESPAVRRDVAEHGDGRPRMTRYRQGLYSQGRRNRDK